MRKLVEEEGWWELGISGEFCQSKTGLGLWVVVGYRQSRLDLVPLRQTPAWQFLAEDAIRLGTGLGEEIVRCVVVDDAVSRKLFFFCFPLGGLVREG